MTVYYTPYRHNWHSSEYVESWFADDFRQKGYLPIRQKLIRCIPFPAEHAIRVLDVGAGDGALSRDVLSTFPKAQLVCHDYSEIMLECARQRLLPLCPSVVFIKSDLLDPAWTKNIKGTFDVIVSSIAIHNVAEPVQGEYNNRITEIYGEIFKLVKPGGCFLNYDLVSPPGPVVEKIYLKERFIAQQTRLKAEKGIEKSLEEIERDFRAERQSYHEQSSEKVSNIPKTDRCIANQIQWLNQAGFDEADCLWKDIQSAILGGFRH